jgi:hypothetical protein
MVEPEHRRSTDFERELLRRSLGTLDSDRDRCVDCERTPLEGERVYRFARGVLVCELCRLRHGGDPEQFEHVRTSEHGHAVRLMPRAA